MRLFIITQDEPLYAPRYLAAIFTALDGRHQVVGVTPLDPGGTMGWWGLARQRLQMYGPVDFARVGARFVAARVRGLLPGRSGARHSVGRLAAAEGAPVLRTGNVNDPEYLDRVRALTPDLIVSVAANQRFGAELLAVPAVAAVNLHSSLLPRYRGLDGLFWALVHGEREVGVTLHEMSEAFDAGAIVAQRPFAVGDGDSLDDLYRAAIEVGAGLLAEAADAYEAGDVAPEPLDVAAGSYFSWPTRDAARRFRAQGRRFF